MHNFGRFTQPLGKIGVSQATFFKFLDYKIVGALFVARSNITKCSDGNLICSFRLREAGCC